MESFKEPLNTRLEIDRMETNFMMKMLPRKPASLTRQSIGFLVLAWFLVNLYRTESRATWTWAAFSLLFIYHAIVTYLDCWRIYLGTPNLNL